jgi:hypothetical protein
VKLNGINEGKASHQVLYGVFAFEGCTSLEQILLVVPVPEVFVVDFRRMLPHGKHEACVVYPV